MFVSGGHYKVKSEGIGKCGFVYIEEQVARHEGSV